MTQCIKCGEAVEFRYIDGKTTPLHFSGGCGWRGTDAVLKSAIAPESECRPTTCDECGKPVFFIRHNGGSVWIDAPLGPPWDKHECKHGSAADRRLENAALIAAEDLRFYAESIVGVAISVEISWDRSCSVVEFITPTENSLFLLVKNEAKRLYAGEDVAGELAVVDLQRFTFRLLARRSFRWPIVAFLNEPETYAVSRADPICPMFSCRMKIKRAGMTEHLIRGHNFSTAICRKDAAHSPEERAD